MSIKFKINDFFHPLSILKLKASLEKSQWYTKEEMERYQISLLKPLLEHAQRKVPYYRTLFDRINFDPKMVNNVKDLGAIPPLTKSDIIESFDDLVSDDYRKYDPVLCRTTGTSGYPVKFYRDKASNILEFCYYWRYWAWAGYRLGMPFAEFSLSNFIDKDVKQMTDYSNLSKRLCINPTFISNRYINEILDVIKKHKCLFLKGTPSSVYSAALIFEQENIEYSFRAVFTTGEMLIPYQKERIEKVFKCKVLDSYGHMEGVVAVSQCSEGSYHINSDYGILEIEKKDNLSSKGVLGGNVMGTSLYNYAMPLIRYKTGDIAEIGEAPEKCECGRTLPVCKSIQGRGQDIIRTPDGRYVTNLFTLFSELEGVLWVQLVQDSLNKLKIKIAKDTNFSIKKEKHFMERLSCLVGNEMELTTEYISREELGALTEGKYKPVVSNIFS